MFWTFYQDGHFVFRAEGSSLSIPISCLRHNPDIQCVRISLEQQRLTLHMILPSDSHSAPSHTEHSIAARPVKFWSRSPLTKPTRSLTPRDLTSPLQRGPLYTAWVCTTNTHHVRPSPLAAPNSNNNKHSSTPLLRRRKTNRRNRRLPRRRGEEVQEYIGRDIDEMWVSECVAVLGRCWCWRAGWCSGWYGGAMWSVGAGDADEGWGRGRGRDWYEVEEYVEERREYGGWWGCLGCELVLSVLERGVGSVTACYRSVR